MTIAERYVRLAHGIHAHHDGFIDSYCGPQNWADNPSSNLMSLLEQAKSLESDLTTIPDGARRAFLQTQLRAMQTMIRLCQGEKIRYTDEVRGLYDIDPVRVPDNELQASIHDLEQSLPGTGSVQTRWLALREVFRVPPERLLGVLEQINTTLHSRSKALFMLPENEDIEFRLVNNKPWSGYNWYLGQAHSRIEINTDLPSYLASLPDLVAHEAYPGHHTERIFKDALQKNGWNEFGLQLLNAPEAVLGEGIATNALEQVMNKAELQSWIAGELAQQAGLSVASEQVELLFQASEAREALGWVNGNVALMVHEDGASDTSALEYLQTMRLIKPEEAQKNLEFIKHPSSRSYVYNYTVGRKLVKDSLGHTSYQALLEQPFTPSQLRAMTKQKA